MAASGLDHEPDDPDPTEDLIDFGFEILAGTQLLEMTLIGRDGLVFSLTAHV